MAKAVVCILVATALVVLLLTLSQNPKPNYRHYNPRGLSRRLGLDTPSPVFDPLVAKMDRETERSREDFEEDKQYFNDDGTLNLRLRLMVLFPYLDVKPQDGMIDSKELEAWLTQQVIDRLHYRTKRELKLRDKDGDGAVSFLEYLPQFSNEDIESNEMGHGKAGWWMEQFRNADVDKNGTLNLYEFRDFLHPEESRNEQIQKWLLSGKIRQMDKDDDQKLSLQEFEIGAYNSYKIYVEHESGGEDVPPPGDIFTMLDLDNDRLLGAEELKPIIKYLCPGEMAFSKYYTSYLIHEADENGDGKLTLEEILNHEYVFYNTLNENNDYVAYHDEL